ncbi:MAG: hypothetical protein Q8K58_09095 [Acidimicrobiales bacterium]|nr:hypothetical protein [Acidimicrobiales bacterium]
MSAIPFVPEPFTRTLPFDQRSNLSGHDPVTVLEAASTVLKDVEERRYQQLGARLLAGDQLRLVEWLYKMQTEGTQVAPVPVHPLAVLAATTVALAHSCTPGRQDRDDLAAELVRVGVQYNALVVDPPIDNDPRAVVAAVARSSLWSSVENEDWVIWTADLVHALDSVPMAASHLAQFETATGLSLLEWTYSTLGERATRQRHEARSWGGVGEMDPDLLRAWRAMFESTVDAVVDNARQAVTLGPLSFVNNPFDLRWLATRPVVAAEGGARRISLWLGALNRALLPSSVAQVLSDSTGSMFDDVAAAFGRAAEHVINPALAGSHRSAGEDHIPEKDIPKRISKCDYLIEGPTALLGIEFTMITPTRPLSAGDLDHLDKFVTRLTTKVEQPYKAFQWRDPSRTKRWLPLVVLVSPSVSDAMVNEWVHARLVESGHAVGDKSELMTCYAPEFLDLIQYCNDNNRSVLDAVLEWRDGSDLGTMLDFWLSDRGGFRASGKARMRPSLDDVEAVLKRAP